MRGPALSVVIPVRNDPANLGRCLTALGAAMRTNFEVEGELVSDEIIVVDDGSTDETADVARRFGVRLMQHDARRGPAAARNHGSEIATNPVLFFVDADVRVAPDTLERVARQARGSPEFEAFFGSYDDQPGAPSLVSQYRNLQHHFVHQTGNAEATTFWSGCGAIWRSTFLKLGGFDTGYRGASIEDIELGGRLRQAGHRIALVKDIQVQHLKRWTYGSMVHCDIF